MSDLTLHSTPFSTYGRTCRMALHWKGVDYELDPVPPQTPEQLERHPWGKVPSMTHKTPRGDIALYETLAICGYVDTAFDGPALAPAAPLERARMEQWNSVFMHYAYRPLANIVLQRVLVPARGGTPDEELIAASMPEATKSMGALDGALGNGGYFAGGGLSLADFMVLPMIDYLPGIAEGDALMAGAPNIARWYNVMSGLACVMETAPPAGD